MNQADERNGIFIITPSCTRSDLTEVNCSFSTDNRRSIVTKGSPSQGRGGGCAASGSICRADAAGQAGSTVSWIAALPGIWPWLSQRSAFSAVMLLVTSMGNVGHQRQTCQHSPPLLTLQEMSQKTKLTSGQAEKCWDSRNRPSDRKASDFWGKTGICAIKFQNDSRFPWLRPDLFSHCYVSQLLGCFFSLGVSMTP